MQQDLREQYERCDRLIDIICKVGNISYQQFVAERKCVKLNTLRGLFALISRDCKIHPTVAGRMIHRTRGNMINMQRHYLNYLNAKDRITLDYYNKIQELISEEKEHERL